MAVKWKKPDEGWHKLNIDGALKFDNKAAGGGVLRNHRGDVVWGFYDHYDECFIVEAELRAIDTGLHLCWKYGIRKIWVETDSKIALQLINNNKGAWNIQFILQSISSSYGRMEVSITHTWREGNTVADWFANKGYREKKFKVIEANEIIGRIRGLVRLDKIGMKSIRIV